MRILVTGAHGQLGRSLLTVLPETGHEAAGVDLPDGDLADAGIADAMLARLAPDQVIHAAAYTAVDQAETDRREAERGNAVATERLAAACEAAGCPLTLISTDYVFAGDRVDGYAEDADRAPVSWYGQTKARAEEAVEAMTVPWRIVRTSWLFGHGPQNFVQTMRRLLATRDTLRVVDDQRGAPTYAVDLARLLGELAGREAWGIFHGTNRGLTTWCGFAREIARISGHDPARIEACSTDEYPTAARRPLNAVLLETRLAAVGVAPMPTWQDALGRYLNWLDRNEGA
jgi:dTDP-4-dehydrorhamnose reductase